MTWSKMNLVTKKDRTGCYDEYKCSECGFKKRYYSLQRDAHCPKCFVKERDFYGVWTVKGSKCHCHYCGVNLIKCPENHPNAKYLHLKRYPEEDLYVCPNFCMEDGGTKPYKRGN